MVSRIVLMGLLASLGLAGGLPGGAAGQGSAPVATLADGRVGQIPFQSRTPARREAAPSAVVVGTLRLPKDAAGRVPAMVTAHGSGGVDMREAAWAERLGALGLATFVVDSFTPRNVRETATDQGRLPTAANVAAALTALRRLATHPRIDPDRIGIIGFSKGGQVALYTALEPFRRGVLDDDRRLYASAYHDFDSERSPRFERGLVTGRGCDMAVDLDRFTVARRGTREDITATAGRYARDCLWRGATIGGDAEARRRAPEDVAAFLRRVLKPETH